MAEKARISSGVTELDRLLGGLLIGDNVVWHDDSGNLASAFCLNFLQTSLAQNKPAIYVSFDRSPKNLLDKLEPLAESPHLTILDGFTCGKGAASPVFTRFYEGETQERTCRIIKIDEPARPDRFAEALYGLIETMEGDVRLIFESLTGMQEVWGGEEAILKFYTHSCPRLYDLDTVAYWIMEKLAHSQRVKAQINQIAQVAIDLSIKRGTTTLRILKAEDRGTQDIDKPHRYWTKDQNIIFDLDKGGRGQINLGLRIKELRGKRGLSQSELAKLVGVTPSTISQVEANIIYPSLPALIKIAEVLSVEISSLFQKALEVKRRLVFSEAEAVPVKFPDLPRDALEGKLLTPPDLDAKMEPCLIEIAPSQTIPAHFFVHKGEEMGYLLSGTLRITAKNAVLTVRAGDTIYLASETPTQWENPGENTARLLWIKAR